jgi:hypothetical protein
VWDRKNKTNQADGSEGSNNGDDANVLEFPAGRPSGRHLLAGTALGSNGGRLSALSRIVAAATLSSFQMLLSTIAPHRFSTISRRVQLARCALSMDW